MQPRDMAYLIHEHNMFYNFNNTLRQTVTQSMSLKADSP